MPVDDRFGLHDDQRGAPVRPEPGKAYPEGAIAWPQFRAFDGLFADCELLSQSQVLVGQVDLGEEHRSEKQHARFQDAHFRTLGHRGNPQF